MIAGVWLACGTDGERAETGECPESFCDPDTPSGLHFYGGSAPGAHGADLPTAIGGTQSYSFSSAGSSGFLDDRETYEVGEVVSSDPGVLAIDSFDQETFVLRGVGEGSAYIRVLNRDGELIDRIELEAARVARVALVSGTVGSAQDRWAFLRGAETDVGFALYDGGGRQLVDESAQFFGSERTSSYMEVVVPAEGDELRLVVTLGNGERLPVTAPIVDRAEHLVRLDENQEATGAAAVMTTAGDLLCYAGAIDGYMVGGLELDVEAQAGGPIEIETEEGFLPSPSCFWVSPTDAGIGVVTVRASGLELVHLVHVTRP